MKKLVLAVAALLLSAVAFAQFNLFVPTFTVGGGPVVFNHAGCAINGPFVDAAGGFYATAASNTITVKNAAGKENFASMYVYDWYSNAAISTTWTHTGGAGQAQTWTGVTHGTYANQAVVVQESGTCLVNGTVTYSNQAN